MFGVEAKKISSYWEPIWLFNSEVTARISIREHEQLEIFALRSLIQGSRVDGKADLQTIKMQWNECLQGSMQWVLGGGIRVFKNKGSGARTPEYQYQFCYLLAMWTSAKLINFFVPQFLHLWYGLWTKTFFVWLHELVFVKSFKQCWKHWKH